jgi:hypothetical protein
VGLLEELIEDYKFFINNNPEIPTRLKLTLSVSIIDLTIIITEMGLLSAWYADSEYLIFSDYKLIVME